VQPFTFFVSYRREDTGPIALLLKSEIEKRLQFVRVIVDVTEMRHGDRFPERIRNLIGSAHATIALIGKRWMPARGQAAAGAHVDWVVKELETSNTAALAHAKADRYGLTERQVLPLFVDRPVNWTHFKLPRSLAYLTATHGKRVDYADWPQTVGPLVQQWAVDLNLKERTEDEEYPPPDKAKASTQPVDERELASILAYNDYDGWYVDNFGDSKVRYLVKSFRFPGFGKAADFMALVSEQCRILNHHPEWRNVFDQVRVALTTWDAKRQVTIYDLNLALFMNKAAEAVMKR